MDRKVTGWNTWILRLLYKKRYQTTKLEVMKTAHKIDPFGVRGLIISPDNRHAYPCIQHPRRRIRFFFFFFGMKQAWGVPHPEM